MYFVIHQPSAHVGQVAHTINTVNTTDSSVIISDLEQTTEYIQSLLMLARQEVNTAAYVVQVSSSAIAPIHFIQYACYRCELPVRSAYIPVSLSTKV